MNLQSPTEHWHACVRSAFTRRCAWPVRSIALALLSLLLVACGHNSSGPNPDQGDGIATLKWQPPKTYENGEPFNDLTAYLILYGRSPENLRYFKRIEDASQTSVVVTGLGKGVWYFSIIAVNSRGHGSPQSEVVSKTIP